MPDISVIMGIYNCQDTLAEAIRSIIGQTYSSWELIVCDDGSTDGTYALADSFRQTDPQRIILLKNERNMGLNHTLNVCLEQARGRYIARMDGDDVSLPQRFEVQAAYLDRHPEHAIVSAAMALTDHLGQWGEVRYPENPGPRDMMRRTPFAHAPSMVRAEAMRAVNGYSVSKYLLRVEDYHLWFKMYRAGFRGHNLQQVLYVCQDDRAARTRRKFRYRVNETYVKWLVFRHLKPGLPSIFNLFKPIITGLMPPFVYELLHKGSLRKRDGHEDA